MDPYLGYVVAAYAISFGGLFGLLAWAILSRRGARRTLARAERSAGRAGTGRA